jgi:hypothetical protein
MRVYSALNNNLLQRGDVGRAIILNRLTQTFHTPREMRIVRSAGILPAYRIRTPKSRQDTGVPTRPLWNFQVELLFADAQ